MAKFSDRMGITQPPSEILVGKRSPALHPSLWNLLVITFQKDWSGCLATLFYGYSKKPLDDLPGYDVLCGMWLKETFDRSIYPGRWYHAYTLIEYILQNVNSFPALSELRLALSQFETRLNKILEQERAGYRAIKGVIVPITAEHEVEAIRQAASVSSLGLDAVSQHLTTALHLLGKKPEPDYRNSIKESSSAVESICKLLTGEKSGGLKDALAELSKKISLHPALKSAFLQLYSLWSMRSMETNMQQIHVLPLVKPQPHPQNPRLLLREEVVEGIAAQLKATGEFSIMHALIVRPVDDYYQIMAGHHREAAARRAGLTEIPCGVSEMSDEDAFMQLVLSNAQSELSPLEIGIHALEYVKPGKNQWTGGGISEYARQIGKDESYIRQLRHAAEVLSSISKASELTPKLRDKAQHLFHVHAAPPDTWLLLVEAMLEGEWSKDDTRKIASRVKETLASIPDWWMVNRLAVASLAIENKAQGLKGVFELAGTLADKLGGVTIYRHEATGETTTR